MFGLVFVWIELLYFEVVLLLLLLERDYVLFIFLIFEVELVVESLLAVEGRLGGVFDELVLG